MGVCHGADLWSKRKPLRSLASLLTDTCSEQAGQTLAFIVSREDNLQDLSIGGGVELAVVARAAVLHAVWSLLQGQNTHEKTSHVGSEGARQRCLHSVCLYLYNWINGPRRQDMVSEQPTAALCRLLVGAFIVPLRRHKHSRGADLQHGSDSSNSSFLLSAPTCSHAAPLTTCTHLSTTSTPT